MAPAFVCAVASRVQRVRSKVAQIESNGGKPLSLPEIKTLLHELLVSYEK